MLPASGELGGGSCNEVTTELTAKGVDEEEEEDDTDDEDTDDNDDEYFGRTPQSRTIDIMSTQYQLSQHGVQAIGISQELTL